MVANDVRLYHLESMPYSSSTVVLVADEHGKLAHVRLVSYRTIVVDIDLTDNTVACFGTYSATTARHISKFTQEFFGVSKYHVFKACDFGAYRPIDPNDLTMIYRKAELYYIGGAGKPCRDINVGNAFY